MLLLLLLLLIVVSPPPSSSSSSSSSPPFAEAVLRVPSLLSISNGLNVCPESLLILITCSFAVWFLSHHVTITLAPSASISTSSDSAAVVLLRFILSPNVCPPSFEALNITSSLPFSVLLVHQATYTLSPVIATGAKNLMPVGANASFGGVTAIVIVP